MLYNSSNSFYKFCNHLSKIVDIQHTPLKKKEKVKIKTLENSKILLLLWYLAPFSKNILELSTSANV
jgi:hypothetical protein